MMDDLTENWQRDKAKIQEVLKREIMPPADYIVFEGTPMVWDHVRDEYRRRLGSDVAAK